MRLNNITKVRFGLSHDSVGAAPLRCLALGFILASSACAGQVEESDDIPGASRKPILSGTADNGRPAIGHLSTKYGGCTATLISSRVILTAAHCFGFDMTQSGLGVAPDFTDKATGATFTLDSGATFGVVKFAVLSVSLGDGDIAVAQLQTDVPSADATPIPVASSAPSDGDTVSAWGYGCIEGHSTAIGPCVVPPGGGAPFFCPNGGTCAPDPDQDARPGGTCLAFLSSRPDAHTGSCVLAAGGGGFTCGAGEICIMSDDQNLRPGGECYRVATAGPGKTSRSVQWNARASRTYENVTCPGDSGGPILDSSGAVIAINSAGAGDTAALSSDTPANAVAHQGFIGRMNAAYGNGVACTTCGSVNIRTNDGIHYIQAVDNGGSSVNATPTFPSVWETFRVVPLGSNFFPIVGLQTDNGYWLSADDGGGFSVVANRTLLGAWEAFYFIPVNSNEFSLATFSKFQFVAAEGGGGGEVNANRPEAQGWETFTLNTVSDALPD